MHYIAPRAAGLLALFGVVATLLLAAAVATGQQPVVQAEADHPILSYPALAPTLAAGAPPQAAGALASVALSADTLVADWQVIDMPAALPDERGHWVVQDGQVLQDGVGPTGAMSMSETILVSPATISDGGISTSFYDELTGTVGLVVRHSAAGFYRLRLHTDPTFDYEALVLEKVIGGVAMPLVVQAGEPLYQRHAWYALSLTVDGDRLIARLNGTVVASVQDLALLPPGGAGVYARALGGVRFAQVVVDGEE